MADKTKIEKAARKMLNRYGYSATREIDLRILELQLLGQLEAFKSWSNVREVILTNSASAKSRTELPFNRNLGELKLHRKSTTISEYPSCTALQPIWEQMDECDRALIRQGVTSKHYKAGQTLYLQGDNSPGIYCIESGLIGLRRSDEKGKSALLRLAKTGEMLGYRSVQRACPHKNTAEVLSDARVNFIERGKIRWLISRSSVLQEHLFQKALQDLDRTEACCAELLTSGLKERLLNLLLDLHKTCVNRDQVNQTRFELPIHKKDIAALLGTSPAALSRVISLLELEGDVLLEGRQITISKHVSDRCKMPEHRYVA